MSIKEDSLKEGAEAKYEEDGEMAKVQILATWIKGEYTHFRLQVLEIIQEGGLGLKPEQIFEVWKKTGFTGHGSALWRLSSFAE